jgi:hypothetical protein
VTFPAIVQSSFLKRAFPSSMTAITMDDDEPIYEEEKQWSGLLTEED